MLKLLHLSDLHFGPPLHPPAVDAALREAAALSPDLIVVSGDFTYRATRRQFLASAHFLKSLPQVPLVTTPGNHDIPFFRALERLMSPYKLYRRHIGSEKDASASSEGVEIVALNTTSPLLRIVEGRITREQIDYCRRCFEGRPRHAVRIVVSHHPFALPRDSFGGVPLYGAPFALAEFARVGVDLVLGGHLHRAYTADSRNQGTINHQLPSVRIVQCGTSTSVRGRGREADRQTFNWIRIDASLISVTVYEYTPTDDRFLPIREESFARQPF